MVDEQTQNNGISPFRGREIISGEHRVEYASSNRSKCRLTGEFIEKDELRIGIAYCNSKINKFFHNWYKWSEFKVRSTMVNDLQDIDYLPEIEKLSQKDIEDVLQFVNDEFRIKVKDAISSLPAEELFVERIKKGSKISLSTFDLPGGIRGLPRQDMEMIYNQRYENPSKFIYLQLRTRNAKVICNLMQVHIERAGKKM